MKWFVKISGCRSQAHHHVKLRGELAGVRTLERVKGDRHRVARLHVLDAFPDEASREAHLAGPIAAALMANAAELLAEPPVIEKVGVLAAKLA